MVCVPLLLESMEKVAMLQYLQTFVDNLAGGQYMTKICKYIATLANEQR